MFVGLPLFFIGTEIVPHLLNPCLMSALFGSQIWPGVCASSAQGGWEFADRWHVLDHMVVGVLPTSTGRDPITG